jgi:hypothetical protein
MPSGNGPQMGGYIQTNQARAITHMLFQPSRRVSIGLGVNRRHAVGR